MNVERQKSKNVNYRKPSSKRKLCRAVCKQASPIRKLTCHMGSHSVTCHPAEVTFPSLS